MLMPARRLPFACFVLCVATSANARKPELVVTSDAPLRHTVASTDTALLATFDFEGPGDTPDPQGWTSSDRSGQSPMFHVDDFAGMGGAYAPLEGTKSLWCGTRPAPEFCFYATLPGYGNGWRQYFTSEPFAVSGNLKVDFLARWDTEPGYDYVAVQYLSKTGAWRYTAYEINGIGSGLYSNVFPADSLATTTRVRIWFASDGAWSDQDGSWNTDGAVEVDSLTLTDDTGVIDYQDFEAEAPFATGTVDGMWTSYGVSPFGDYAGLFDGDNVFQADTLTLNHSHFWGFFNGSTETMACEGHPEQAVPPGPAVVGNNTFATTINNHVVSPPIDLTTDIDGLPVPWDAIGLVVDFDLYADNESHVSHVVSAEFLVDGCWRFNGYYGPGSGSEAGGSLTAKAWVHRTTSISIPPGATLARVTMGAVEGAWVNAPHCHNPYPLYDNVEVRAFTEFTTGAGPSRGRTHLEQNHPNPFNPVTTIGYTLAAAGPVTLRIYDVSGALVRTLVDANQRPADGPFRVEWDGRDNEGSSVSSGVYFYRLDAAGVSETRKMVLLK